MHTSTPRATRYCTALFGLLTPAPQGFTLTLAGGGRPPPLLLRGDGTVQTVDLAGGQLIGCCPSRASPPPPFGLHVRRGAPDGLAGRPRTSWPPRRKFWPASGRACPMTRSSSP
ncbi:SpoIIE family protein phosphatase [Streptomyces sp. NPDC060035]|uniref:SpoIIE family protein phosphatase n=1 Tax=Streptomyces sp. NPDC060035 TaxID=3347044 RepID=UPI0036B3E3AD